MLTDWHILIVACWPLTTRAALSRFSVNMTRMFLCGKIGWESATQAQGMLVRGRPWNRWPTMMVLIRCAPLRETVITVLLRWLWKAVQIWLSVRWPSRQRTMPSCILSTCSCVGRMNRMRSRNAAYSGSTILNCWCKVWMTALAEVKVALWLIMDMVEVMRPFTVCRGCCWHLSPARTTRGAKVHPIERGRHYCKDGQGDHQCLVNNNHVILVNARVDFVGDRAVNRYAESTMKGIGGHVLIENGVVAFGQQGTGAATRTDSSWRMAYEMARMRTCDLPVLGFPKRTRYFCQVESGAAERLCLDQRDWR